MTDSDDDLENCIAHALAHMGYDPPRRNKPAERALYYRAAARAVRKQLSLSWVVTRKPPSQIAPSMWKPGDRTPEER